MKKIKVLIPDADCGHALVVAKALAREKVEIHSMSPDSNAALKFSRYNKSFLQIPSFIENEKEVLDVIVNKSIEKRIDLVLPIDESTHQFFSRIKEEVQNQIKLPPISSSEILKIATNKWELHNFCIVNNIAVPQAQLLNDSENYPKENLNFPILIKPDKGHGGHFIHKFLSLKKFNEFRSKVHDLRLGNLLVQEYIEGYDIDMSVLANHGKILAYTIQKGFLKRRDAFAASAGIKFIHVKEVYDIVHELTLKLNFSGVAHIDLRYDSIQQKFKIIEINARYWGSLMGSVLAGVNFPYLACLNGLGISHEIPDFRECVYIDYVSGMKSLIRNPLSSKQKEIRLKNTDVKYLMKDPIAEIINIVKRRRTSRKFKQLYI